mmetsp:Transcript_23901/g.28921  ORF Transcript_23901/g.28921 Transcript_23901/m.28921 type:complete len:851 (-) Transcript_23901:232-2784(-)|eukprot:CAMPEP_0197859656 /NCGR_PEP_ID=MMETSP1438-20131217/34410_1 /TAXON_ID=1461541 /ORGANISM="Pterosperma sp., Strain CCMP1384" /LENGTH=850 /DNA_ID=CAMNT_0043476235 /DNA_START=347 /DNA_END=2899 /DNA_ORIENTATION=+
MHRGSFQNLQDLLAPCNQGSRVEEDSDDETPEDTSSRLIVVSNQLPLKATRNEDGTYSFEWDKDALLQQAMEGMTESSEVSKVMFIGQLPVAIGDDQQEEISAQLLQDFQCLPVFLPKMVKEAFYQGMCKKIMWPLFHYVLPLSPQSDARYNPAYWQSYIAANRKFADVVIEILKESDFVWAHDYHLLLLPTLLRKKFNTVRCGFFLHSPFPSSEMFRAFPMRAELLRGLLNADLVGFHTFDYARHFLSCCSRMLGLEFESKRGSIELEYFGRRVRMRISPVGLQVSRFKEVLASQECIAKQEELQEKYKDKIVLVGVDDMDPFKGIDLKIQALKAMLQAHPELADDQRVVLIQVCNPARSNTKEVIEMRESVLQEAQRIKEDVGYEAVEIWERSVPLHERAALYSISTACLVTATRDGMNLVPYEYVVCRQGMTDDSNVSHSMLVVSEFVGCTPSLCGAIRINPWSIKDTADAIHRAVTMSLPERTMRHDQHYRYINKHTVSYWARNFFTALSNVCEEIQSMRCYGLGFGLSFRVVALQSHFKLLEPTNLLHAYENCKRVAILLDYDGTLTSERGCSLPIPPSPQVEALLNSLTRTNRNTVYIISGRGRQELSEWFSKVPNLGLASEHGNFCRRNSSSPWQTISGLGPDEVQPMVEAWKRVTKPILESYAESTDGSFIQDKESAMVWHFHDADPDFGNWQAKELVTHLEDLLADQPVDISVGQFTVEVKPKGISKGVAVEHVIEKMEEDGGFPDMVLCVGDDRSDEEMYIKLEELSRKHRELKVMACTVGQKPSRAAFYVNDHQEVIDLLKALESWEEIGHKTLHRRVKSVPAVPLELVMETDPAPMHE